MGVFACAADAPVAAQPAAPAFNVEELKPLSDALVFGDATDVVKLAEILAAKGSADSRFVVAVFKDIGAGTSLDHAGALKILESLHKEGYAQATWYLRTKYSFGFGSPIKNEKSLADFVGSTTEPGNLFPGLERWLVRAKGIWLPNFIQSYVWMTTQAQAGNRVAMHNLVAVLKQDLWTKASPTQRFIWLSKLHELKDTKATEELAEALLKGEGTEKDFVKSEALFVEAAKAGSASALASLAKHREDGAFGREDLSGAFDAWTEAAALGNEAAEKRLIKLGRADGLGRSKDPALAFAVAKKSDALGHISGTQQLGTLYADGIGTKQDYTKALELFRKAAAAGDAYSVGFVAWLLDTGRGCEPNSEEALKLYERAAEGGEEVFLDEWVLLLESAKAGGPNYKKAFEIAQKAARDGISWHQNHLGWMLINGFGVEKDPAEAVDWFRLALKQGNGTAASNLAREFITGGAEGKNLPEALKLLREACRLETQNSPWFLENLYLLLSEYEGQLTTVKKTVEDFLADPESIKTDPLFSSLLAVAIVQSETVEFFKGSAAFVDQAAALREPVGADKLMDYFIDRKDYERAHVAARCYANGNKVFEELLHAKVDLNIDDPADSAKQQSARHRLEMETGTIGSTFRSYAAWALGKHLARNAKTSDEFKAARRLAERALENQIPPFKAKDSDEKALSRMGWIEKPQKSEREFQERCDEIRQTGETKMWKLFQSAPLKIPYALAQQKRALTATVDFVISRDGYPTNISITESCDFRFTEALRKMISKERYLPMFKDGEFVETNYHQEQHIETEGS